jgi:hypothetical protein
MKDYVESEMVRNANENQFQTSKMAVGGHFDKNIKVEFWSEMARNISYQGAIEWGGKSSS